MTFFVIPKYPRNNFDDFRIYSRNLTDQEISELQNINEGIQKEITIESRRLIIFEGSFGIDGTINGALLSSDNAVRLRCIARVFGCARYDPIRLLSGKQAKTTPLGSILPMQGTDSLRAEQYYLCADASHQGRTLGSFLRLHSSHRNLDPRGLCRQIFGHSCISMVRRWIAPDHP